MTEPVRRPLSFAPGTSIPDWDPTPDEPFPKDALTSPDDLPGETVDGFSYLDIGTLTQVFGRSGRFLEAPPPLFLGPEGKVYAVPSRVVEGLRELHQPIGEFSERVTRFWMDEGDSREHGRPPRLEIAAWFDLPLEAIRDATFRIENLATTGYGSASMWRERFERWEASLRTLLRFANALDDDEGIYLVQL